MKSFFLNFVFILFYFSCSSIYGIKKQETVNINQIQKFQNNLNNKNFTSVIIDRKFISWANALYKTDSTYRKYHLQPLQALYFNKQKEFVSYHVNCNAGGFPNLKWNRYNQFQTFPPVTQTTPDNQFDLSMFLSNNSIKDENPDYYVIVFWNLLMERQSKNLIELVTSNIEKSEAKIQLILINNDALYVQ